MNGLRVYTDAQVAGGGAGDTVFYSRRESGPFYMWLCEGEPGVWRCSRVRLTKALVTVLRGENLKSVPAALLARLGEHYLE
jgi:hypothetical protein